MYFTRNSEINQTRKSIENEACFIKLFQYITSKESLGISLKLFAESICFYESLKTLFFQEFISSLIKVVVNLLTLLIKNVNKHT